MEQEWFNALKEKIHHNTYWGHYEKSWDSPENYLWTTICNRAQPDRWKYLIRLFNVAIENTQIGKTMLKALNKQHVPDTDPEAVREWKVEAHRRAQELVQVFNLTAQDIIDVMFNPAD